MGMANAYGREFGLKDPLQELKLLKSKKDGNGQDVVRFQQVYMGVPILAGELIVNMNEAGELLSMSGEVSSDLTLDTRPAIKAQDARKTALDEIAQLHNVDEKGLLATQAELWIFDESLLTVSTRPVGVGLAHGSDRKGCHTAHPRAGAGQRADREYQFPCQSGGYSNDHLARIF